MTGRLAGKTAIVTGAASGIGFATAALFVAEGANVIAADLGMPELEGTIGIAADAGDEVAVKGLVERARKDFGGLDVFFANAGISGGFASLFEQSPEDWQEILRVNLIGPSLAIKHAAPAMKEGGGGSIICTASVAGLRSGAGGPAYSASKAGVINLVQVAATQLAGANIRVNAICPGLIETGMTRPIFDMARDSGKEARLGHLNPLKRGGQPEEIAHAALFLASDESSYVNGHALVVDGGLSASHPFNHQTYGRTAF
jgi:NAD(P)-dependent dehydrogenase (short-subunit alcohol dehydrogenase family)